MDLVGRSCESSVLEELAGAVRTGLGRALVVRGEPGIGKSALIEQLVLPDLQLVRAVGVESETELAFGGLHQLCAPLLDLLPTLPGPQRDALGTVFGLRQGRPPDRLLVGLGVLSLLCEAAERKPLLCVVDDGHWLDRSSAQAVAFVGRRLLADPVGVVIATRDVDPEFSGWPELVVGGLAPAEAMALLRSLPGAPLDTQVRDRIVAEAHGNPLALLEWRRTLTPAEQVGGLPVGGPLMRRLEESFRRRLARLPAETQRLLLIAAAEPLGDASLVWRAADRLDVSTGAGVPAVDAGLIDVGTAVRFTHPLVRSASYQSASVAERQRAHRALTEVMGPDVDPDRRAWHRALATPGPDEEVADELERSASRAQGRGGMATAAAFQERSAALTLDPHRRAQRTIAAAAAHLEAGTPKAALAILATAEAAPLDELQRARVEILRGETAGGWGDASDAVDFSLSAARRLEPLDVRLARDTYLRAYMAADLAGDLARGATIEEVAQAARAAPAPPGPGRPEDLLLDGLAVARTDGLAAAAPILREAISAFATVQLSPEEMWRLGHLLPAAALLWDYSAHYALGARLLQAARDLGALWMLTMALDAFARMHVWAGDLATAASLLEEARSFYQASGGSASTGAFAELVAWRGHEAEARSAIAATIEHARARGHGRTIKVAWRMEATLFNGLGRYEQALIAAQEATNPPLHASSYHALRELVEAAMRSGRPAVAADALERLSESTQASGTDWALGVEARSRALLRTGNAAEALYHEAIERLDPSPLRPDAARAHLLYGEWLRRENRRVDARHQLRIAHEMLTAIGANAFADRARRELLATGETVRKRGVQTTRELTDQEACVARLVGDGLTNAEIGAQLFISTRTVEWHLRKVFSKLEVGSRRELRSVVRSSSLTSKAH
jgi:DNA-binding CsgD family transcriptional regulator